MKSLNKYINERLSTNRDKILLTPKSKDELISIILDHFNNGVGNLNDIDVSELKKEDFYRLFNILKNDIWNNNITEINISNWKLKELYYDENRNMGMFEYCNTLETIILPKYLEVIDKFTFYKCNNLHNIIIPESVTSISYSVFGSCPNLTITVPNKQIKKLVEDSGFNGEIIIKLH